MRYLYQSVLTLIWCVFCIKKPPTWIGQVTYTYIYTIKSIKKPDDLRFLFLLTCLTNLLLLYHENNFNISLSSTKLANKPALYFVFYYSVVSLLIRIKYRYFIIADNVRNIFFRPNFRKKKLFIRFHTAKQGIILLYL